MRDSDDQSDGCDSLEDRETVWKRGSWLVKPGTLRLQRWVSDFNPYKTRTSVAQIWIRIYELSLEYWHPSMIFGIARAVGKPLKIDDRSLCGIYGHYVRVLVEVDLSMPLQDQVMVERTGHCAFVSIAYEYLPEFCSHCRVVGHSVSKCSQHKKTSQNETRDPKVKGSPRPSMDHRRDVSARSRRGRSLQRKIYRGKSPSMGRTQPSAQ